MKLKKQIFAVALLTTAMQAQAGPWIESNDPLLRASIEVLFNQGMITQPINSYPLMWQGIAKDISTIRPSELDENSLFAYQHVKTALAAAKQSSSSGVRLNYNSEPGLQQSFGWRDQQQSGINSYGSITGKRVSAKVSVNYADDALDGKYTNYYGSYLAVLMGNWSISAEQIDHWWGPSNDNALLVSNNAAPMKGVRINRASSKYVGPSWLAFIGNWQLTARYAKQQPSLLTNTDGDYWAVRFSSTPITGLEIALSMVGSDFLTNTDIAPDTLEQTSSTEQLSSIDIKYSTSLAGQPIAIYGELMGNNKQGLLPSNTFYTLGIESYFTQNSSLLKSYFEYSNTVQNCASSLDCTYGNDSLSNEQTGYINKGRLIGSSIPEQSKSAVLGSYYHTLNGYGGYGKIRWQDTPASIESNNQGLTRWQLELGYQQALFDGLWKVSTSIYKDTISSESETHAALKTSWEFRF